MFQAVKSSSSWSSRQANLDKDSHFKFFSNQCEEIKILANVFLILRTPRLIPFVSNTRTIGLVRIAPIPKDEYKTYSVIRTQTYSLDIKILVWEDRGRRVMGDGIRCGRIGQVAAARTLPYKFKKRAFKELKPVPQDTLRKWPNSTLDLLLYAFECANDLCNEPHSDLHKHKQQQQTTEVLLHTVFINLLLGSRPSPQVCQQSNGRSLYEGKYHTKLLGFLLFFPATAKAQMRGCSMRSRLWLCSGQTGLINLEKGDFDDRVRAPVKL